MAAATSVVAAARAGGGDGGVPVHLGGEPAAVVDQLELTGEQRGVWGTRGCGELGEQGADALDRALDGVRRCPQSPQRLGIATWSLISATAG
jgi:hypothetical protein